MVTYDSWDEPPSTNWLNYWGSSWPRKGISTNRNQSVSYDEVWVNYNISLNWIKAIWGWFPLPWFQWGRSELVIIYPDEVEWWYCSWFIYPLQNWYRIHGHQESRKVTSVFHLHEELNSVQNPLSILMYKLVAVCYCNRISHNGSRQSPENIGQLTQPH